jgi:hypothetical protein
MLQRFLRLDSTYADPEQHTIWERVLWALPPVLIAWMLTYGPLVLLQAILTGRF